MWPALAHGSPPTPRHPSRSLRYASSPGAEVQPDAERRLCGGEGLQPAPGRQELAFASLPISMV